MRFPLRRRPLLVLAVLAAMMTSACGTGSTATDDRDVIRHTNGARSTQTRYVLAISVDGLNAHAIEELGRRGAPNFHRLIRDGASTLNARTARERTVTLPNHTSMVTGRRVIRSRVGHGVTFNHDNGHTVQRNAGHAVSSVFSTVHKHGGRTALFASKSKFAMFKRSWPHAVDRFTDIDNNLRLARSARADLVAHPRSFTFLHLSLPDDVGHDKGFMSAAYLDAVRRTDRNLGELVRAITSHARLRDHLTVIVTADHGGSGAGHSDPTQFVNFRVPFIVWGAGVKQGTRLYDLNPAFRAPGFRRTRYSDAKQPIRNGDVANLSTSLLGLGPVPGSEFNSRQRLVVH